MKLSLKYFVSALKFKNKKSCAVPILDLSRLSAHDVQDINLPPNHAQRLRFSHELDDWRARHFR